MSKRFPDIRIMFWDHRIKVCIGGFDVWAISELVGKEFKDEIGSKLQECVRRDLALHDMEIAIEPIIQKYVIRGHLYEIVDEEVSELYFPLDEEL